MNHRSLTKRLDDVERLLGDDQGEKNTNLLRVWLADDDEPLPPGPAPPGSLRAFLGRKPLSTDALDDDGDAPACT